MKKNGLKFLKTDKDPLFESLMIYLACWCKKEDKKGLTFWKLSDFYGLPESQSKRFKGILTGKSRSSMSSTAKDRINRLKKAKVPIKLQDIDLKRPKMSKWVEFDYQEVVQEFIAEINFSEEESKLFQEVIETALPLIRENIDCFIQAQTFFNESLENIIRFYIEVFVKMGECLECIKYFPIWLSFSPALIIEKELFKSVIKWKNAISRSSSLSIPNRINGLLFLKVPYFKEILLSIISSLDLSTYSSFVFPSVTLLNRQLSDFTQYVKTTREELIQTFFDPNSKNLFVFGRLPEEAIIQKIPKNKQYSPEWDRRAIIAGKMLFHFMLDLFKHDQLNYKRKIMISSVVPSSEGIESHFSLVDLNCFREEKKEITDKSKVTEYEAKVTLAYELFIKHMNALFTVENIDYSKEVSILSKIPKKGTNKFEQIESKINLQNIFDYKQ